MRSTSQTITPAAGDSQLLYRMPGKTRFVLWVQRLGLMIGLLLGLFWSVNGHGFLRGLFIFLSILSALILYASYKQTGGIVVRADSEEGEIRFRRWNGTSVAV